MTSPDTLRMLRERVVGLTGGDREVDRELAVLAGLTWGAGHPYDDPWLLRQKDPATADKSSSSAYNFIIQDLPLCTASIDAAIGLGIRLGLKPRRLWEATLWRMKDIEMHGEKPDDFARAMVVVTLDAVHALIQSGDGVVGQFDCGASD